MSLRLSMPRPFLFGTCILSLSFGWVVSTHIAPRINVIVVVVVAAGICWGLTLLIFEIGVAMLTHGKSAGSWREVELHRCIAEPTEADAQRIAIALLTSKRLFRTEHAALHLPQDAPFAIREFLATHGSIQACIGTLCIAPHLVQRSSLGHGLWRIGVAHHAVDIVMHEMGGCVYEVFDDSTISSVMSGRAFQSIVRYVVYFVLVGLTHGCKAPSDVRQVWKRVQDNDLDAVVSEHVQKPARSTD